MTYYEYPEALRGAAFETVMPVTDPSLTNTYKAFEVTASKRSSQNWQMMATFGSTWRDQPVGGDLVALTPNAEIFTARKYRDWYGKVGGSYRFTRPGVLASANLTAVNGEPYARTVLFTGGRTITSIVVPVEPIGTRRYPNVYLLDLRVEKALQFGQPQAVGAGGSVQRPEREPGHRADRAVRSQFRESDVDHPGPDCGVRPDVYLLSLGDHRPSSSRQKPHPEFQGRHRLVMLTR